MLTHFIKAESTKEEKKATYKTSEITKSRGKKTLQKKRIS